MPFSTAQSQYLADLLTGLGSGFMAAPRGGPPLAGFSMGIQNAGQLTAQRRQQQDADQERQYRAAQMARQQKMDAEADARTAGFERQKSVLLGQPDPRATPKFVGGAGSGPGNFQQPQAPARSPFLDSWTPAQIAAASALPADQFVSLATEQAFKAPNLDAPTTQKFEEGDVIITKQWNPATRAWDEQSRAPRWHDAPKGLSDLQQRALDANLKPGTPEYRNFMLRGGAQPKVKTRPMTADEVKARGLDATGVYSIDADDNIHVDQKPKEPGGPFPGTSVDAGSLNIVTAGQGDPALRAKPEYAAAWHQLYEQEQHQQIPDPNDPTGSTMVTISWMPKPPNGFIGPGSAAPATVTAPPSQTPPATPLPKGGESMAAPSQTVPATDDRPAASVVPGTEARKARPVPPTGYQYDGAGNLSFIPGGPADPNTPTPEQRNKINEKLAGLDRLQAALDNYKNLVAPKEGAVDKDGSPTKAITPGIAGSVMGLPTESASQLGTAYTALAIEAKNLFELGALSGPDYGLIQQTLKDPNTTGGYMQETGGRVKQIDEVQKILDNSRASWEKNYAPALRGAGGAKSIDELKNKYGITPVNP